MATTAHVHTHQLPGPAATHEVDLEQQAREFRIPEFTPPWSYQRHPAMTEARDAADAWARGQFRTLAGSERFVRNMASDINTLLTAGVYSTGPAWGLEFAMMYMLFLLVLDDEVLATSGAFTSSAAATTALAQIFMELQLVIMSSFPHDTVLQEGLERILTVDAKWAFVKRGKIDEFLAACALKQPGTVGDLVIVRTEDYRDDESTKDESPITSAWRDLWKRATSAMPQDWSQRFAHISQRDMFAMFREAEERNQGLPPNSIPVYIQKRREYGFTESSLVVGELAEGIHVSNEVYCSVPMQRLVQAANDVVVWHNDIHSFQKELLAGEVNLVHLISKRDGCSYNRAAEMVNDMVVDRIKDLSVAAAELRHHSHFKKEPVLDSEAADKYIRLCTNFISATHVFHQRSSRFEDKVWTVKCV